MKVKITGIYDSGDSDNNGMYIPSIVAQTLANLPDSIDKIEVKALTTPDNDLARKASKNPKCAYARRVGDMVLHRISVIHRLSDRRGDSGVGGQAGASGRRIAGRCASENDRR